MKAELPTGSSEIPSIQEPAKKPKSSYVGVPGVYAFMLGDSWLYIGSTNDLSRRPGQRNKDHKSRYSAILACDRVEFIPCASLVVARQQEELLIRQHPARL